MATTLAELRNICKRDLMDPTGKWWPSYELDEYINDWQDRLQDEFEFCWATTSVLTSTATHTLSTIIPTAMRLDAVYWNDIRLGGTTKLQLDHQQPDWRNVIAGYPCTTYQNDSRDLVLWPAPSIEGTLTLEYPLNLSFSGDSDTLKIPEWTRFSCPDYVAYRAYRRTGATLDPNRAAIRKAKFLRAMEKYRKLYSNYFPEKFLQIRPGSRYEADILIPKPAIGALSPVPPIATPIPDYTKKEFDPSLSDGSNVTYTLDEVPLLLQVFRQGQLQTVGVDYTISGKVITFLYAPTEGDRIVAFSFRSSGVLPSTSSVPSYSGLSGTKNGVNTVFTLASVPSLMCIIFFDGEALPDSTGYSRTGSTITFDGLHIPQPTTNLWALLW